MTLPPDTLPGTHKIPTCLPSACKSLAKIPGVSDASSTTAPAPSPNSTQVVRSEKSKMREKTSAPTTSALLAAPVLIMASATLIAYTKPLQTAWISNAGQPAIPSLFCKMQALDGNTMSGVDVATMMRSISPGCKPAACKAFFAASKAKSLHDTSGAAKCRAWMPVRSTIHSSEVSMPVVASRLAKSALVSRSGGK